MISTNKRIAIVPKGLIYQKKVQTRVSSGRWLPKFGGMASASREKAFRHVWSKRGDRRLGFFQFRITRDDGTLIDHTLLLDRYTGIFLWQEKVDASGYVLIGEAHAYDPVEYPDEVPYWNKIGDAWYYKRDKYEGFPIEFSYNTVTHIWTIPFYAWGDEWYPVRKGKKFYASFACKDSVPATYIKSPKDNPEYIYKTTYSASAIIRPGFYEVRAPYYAETLSTTPVFVPDEALLEYGVGCGYEYSPDTCYGKTSRRTAIIKSSIEYNVNFWAGEGFRGMFYGNFAQDCTDNTCEECSDEAIEQWYYFPYPYEGAVPGDRVNISEYVRISTSNGIVSNNVQLDPIDSNQIVTPTPYTVEEQTFTMDLAYTYPGGNYTLERPCTEGDSPIEFDLTFGAIGGRFYILATPNT